MLKKVIQEGGPDMAFIDRLANLEHLTGGVAYSHLSTEDGSVVKPGEEVAIDHASDDGSRVALECSVGGSVVDICEI